MNDIIYKTKDFIFSYRICGVLIRDGKLLLQKVPNDPGYAFPGGHVSFGETSDQALIREFREEMGADIRVERLLLLCENFCPWGDKPCQQVCLFYLVSPLEDAQLPDTDRFPAFGDDGKPREDLYFHWIPLERLEDILLYPTEAGDYVRNLPEHIQYFVHKE